ncbi:MAG: hypothetical protein QW299_07290 [Candidatus Caldarchaeum sp.]|jgi:hypothetical protein
MEEKDRLAELAYWLESAYFEGLIDTKRLDLSDPKSLYVLSQAIRFLQIRYLRDYLTLLVQIYSAALSASSAEGIQELWDRIRSLLEELHRLYFSPFALGSSPSSSFQNDETQASAQGPKKLNLDDVFRQSKTREELGRNLQRVWEAYFGKIENIDM